ncbi:MAG: 50S ribosomal protein L20 [Armatimonadetes bacterium]|nr:50S ribosomal protein L20 [Armatimonadota bacterium]
MPRVKTGPYRRRRHKKIIEQAEGYWGKRSIWYRVARENVMRAGNYAYVHRKTRKREFRALWIARISAAVRSHGMRYNDFMNGLRKAGVALDRKVLAHMALEEPESFAQLVQVAQQGLALAPGTS